MVAVMGGGRVAGVWFGWGRIAVVKVVVMVGDELVSKPSPGCRAQCRRGARI